MFYHRKLFQEGPHSTVESFLAESIKIFSTTPNADFVDGPKSNESIPPFTSVNTVPAGGATSPTSGQPATSATESPTKSSPNSKYSEDLATFLINRACSNDTLANYFFWYLMVECEGASKSATSSATTFEQHTAAPIHSSIVSSAYTTSYLVPSPPIFNNETEPKWNRDSFQNNTSTNLVVEMYLMMMKRFSARLLRGGLEMSARHKFLLRQQDFVVKLVEIMKDVARESGNRTKKIEKLQRILASPEPQHRFNFSQYEPLPLPLNPEIKIVGVAAKEATLFKSAMMPAKLAFYTTDGSIYYMIFKHGDDLRQDDLVLQMIILMDKLLRMENLDLKLTAYRVLACSSKNGFVQFIDSLSVADVLSTEGSIQNYLRKISANVGKSNPTIHATNSSSSLDFQFISSGMCFVTRLLCCIN